MRTIHDKVCYLRFKSVKISNADNNYIGKYYKWDNNLISKLVIYARKKGWYNELLFVDLNFKLVSLTYFGMDSIDAIPHYNKYSKFRL